jgi:hypothetical protein
MRIRPTMVPVPRIVRASAARSSVTPPILHVRHQVDGHHHLIESEEHPRHHEEPQPTIGQRFADGGAARRDGPIGRGSGRGRRKAREQAPRNGEDPDEGAEHEVRGPPAEPLDQERGQARAGDEGQIEPGQQDAERQAPSVHEPARHGRGGDQVDRRHRDAQQHAEHGVEVPERVDPRREREERAHEDRAHRQDQARAVPIAGGTDEERDEAADDQIQRRRHRDRPATPAELARQYRKKHAEPGMRVPDAEHHERAGAYHHPALPAADVGHVVAMIPARRRETYQWPQTDQHSVVDAIRSGKRARGFSIAWPSTRRGISVAVPHAQ